MFSVFCECESEMATKGRNCDARVCQGSQVAQSVAEELPSKSVVVNSGRESAVSCSFCFNDASENIMWVVRRKMRVYVLVVWLLINLVVNFAMRHGIVVEGDSEVEIMS